MGTYIAREGHGRRSEGGLVINKQVTLTMIVVSSEALAMTLSLWGHQSMSSTGAVWPLTVG